MGEWHTRARQTKILLKKNFILSKRNVKSTLLMLLVPFLFVFLLWILQFGLKENNRNEEAAKPFPSPEAKSIGPIPRCIVGKGKDYCLTLAYTSNTPIGDYVVEQIRKENNIPVEEIKSFGNQTLLDEFLYNNLNITTAAVEFMFNATENTLHYTMQYNKTTIYVQTDEVFFPTYIELPWMYAIETHLARNVTNNPNLKYNIDFIEYAHPELFINDAIATMGPIFFFASLLFNVVIQLGQIVKEKELKLREGMNMMGLYDSVYWLTWTLTNISLNMISALVLTASGYIFQFDFFKKNDFGTFFFLFLLFSISMVPFVFFLSTLIKKADVATSIGFVIFLIGIVIQGVAAFAFTEDFFPVVRVIFSLLPFALLSKGIDDLSNAAIGSTANGLRWSQRFDNAWFDLNTVYGWFIIDFFFYFVLALYLDNVIETEYGVSKHPLFFLQPSYWNNKPPKAKVYHEKEKPSKSIRMESINNNTEIIDEDVLAEKEMIISGNVPPTTAVRIENLRKAYRRKSCCKTKEFVAVKGTYLTIDQGQLFVILGHNGAGKTTTFNILTGLFKPTSGDAFVYGHSVVSGMANIRRNGMGICYQHDILFSELTGREHLEIYAAFKGIPDEKIDQEVQERLRDVELSSHGDIMSSKYSGGMRRRLSTAISLIGDPKIVYLDEPTTGLDPVTRREVWNLIERCKRDRVIILTTHSMEEAEVLGDRIGIMKKGKLVCLGTSLKLKNKFGTGYFIVVVLDISVSNAAEQVKEFFMDHMNITPKECTVTSLEFSIPRDQLSNLQLFFEKIENAKGTLPILDLQISLTTLEQVFLTIAGQHE
ncbi:hypothetical protein CYY_005683 [Polysphondylium violaceum]|uniref:ABC transporter domain-containing protein n=1 Tax=Polysphondylium violaceum TaxID=133409 RepID=A0A8J4UYK6_9MYCE|nr:hypothetical protein CYY_005683 [Polysphondylium violaceum]